MGTAAAMGSNLLSRGADEAVLDLVRELLRETERAAGAVGRTTGGEALHRFRVALRRLRSTLRAHRAILAGHLPRRRRRALRVVADATSAARDAEVQIVWLRRESRTLGRDARAAAAFVEARILRGAGRKEAFAAAGKFDRVARKLRRDLRALPSGKGRAPFGAAMAGLLRAHAADLALALGEVRRESDAPAAHALRIRAKRLRYLLEPVADVPTVGAALAALKRLQRGLGELHDAQVLEATLLRARRAAAEDLPAPQASRVRRGLGEIETRRRRRARERFAGVVASLRPTMAASLLASLERIAVRLAARRSGRGAARRRTR